MPGRRDGHRSSTTALAACGSDDSVVELRARPRPPSLPGKGKPAVTLGDKNFTEQYILGELYAQALEAKGYTVKVKSNIGSSEITDKALTSGQIDLYPEYTGVIATELAKLGDQPASARRHLRQGEGVRGEARLTRCSRRRRSSTPTASRSSRPTRRSTSSPTWAT